MFRGLNLETGESEYDEPVDNESLLEYEPSTGSFGQGTPTDWYKDAAASDLESPMAWPSSVSADADQAGGLSGAVINSDRAFSSAFQQIPTARIKQVWEIGVWESIFGDNPEDPMHLMGPNIYRPLPPDGVQTVTCEVNDEPRVKRSRKSILGPLSQSVISAVEDQHWKEKRELEFRDSLELWVGLIHSWKNPGDIVTELQSCEDLNQSCAMLNDLFKGKAPATLRKRARALMYLAAWLEDQQSDMPCTEPEFYKYLVWLRDECNAPPSRRQAALEGVRFARFVLGVSQLNDICTSRRCRGSCKGDPTVQVVQASALTVKELRDLHEKLASQEDLWDSLAAGAILLAVYTRARWSDLMHTESWVIDLDEDGSAAYLECLAGVHKTMASAYHRFRMLPLVAPSKGVVEDNWIEQWMTVRSKLELKPPPLHSILPAPKKDGTPAVRRVETTEVTRWLHGLLDHEAGSGRRLTSHSIKATMLSYAAKFGMPAMDRLVLGYHAGGAQMAITYSRDTSAPQMRMMEDMLAAIREGSFWPDLARSMRLQKETSNNCVAVTKSAAPVKVEIFESDSEAGSAGEEPATASDSSSTSEEQGEGVFVEPREPVLEPVFKAWVHNKSKTCHLMYSHYKKVFLCGRCVGPFHVVKEGMPPDGISRCRMCFKQAKNEGHFRS